MARAVDEALLKHVDSSLPEMVDIDIIYTYILYIQIEREVYANGCSANRVLLSHGSYMYVKYII